MVADAIRASQGSAFVDVELLRSGLELGSLIAFIALGYALVFGLLRFVNFAHGDLVTLGGYSAWLAMTRAGVGLMTASLIAAITCGVAGIAIERLAFRPLRERRLSMFLASFGVSLLINAVITLAFGSTTRILMPLDVSRQSLLPTVALGITLVAGMLWLTRSASGLAARGIADSPETAALAGIDVDRVVTVVFFLSSALAGLAGVFIAAGSGLTPDLGAKYGVQAFAVVVIAGFGSIAGIAAVGLLVGVVFNQAIYLTGSYSYANVALFAAMTVVLLLKPYGLFGIALRRI